MEKPAWLRGCTLRIRKCGDGVGRLHNPFNILNLNHILSRFSSISANSIRCTRSTHPSETTFKLRCQERCQGFFVVIFLNRFYIFVQVSKIEKILMLLLSGRSDTNFEFTDLITLLKRLGFTMRIKGSHHIFYRDDIDEIINLQPDKNKAKPYQVKQIRI